MMKTKILEHVRNVCGLKKLEFGCEVVSREFEGRGKIIGCGIKYIIQQPALNDGLSSEHSTYQLNESQFTIIGLPVHLEHLLFAIPNFTDRWGNNDKLFELFAGYNHSLDLTKTVEQNLENEALCKLLVEVLNIK